jgi:hypothetical protein
MLSSLGIPEVGTAPQTITGPVAKSPARSKKDSVQLDRYAFLL